MKKTTVLIALSLLAACKAPQADDKKAELEKLRKERNELSEKITALEEEMAKSDTSASGKGIEVTAMAMKPEHFRSYIDVQGRVDADESVSISSELPGTVTKINVNVGDKVSKGDVLAETDSRAMQQQVAAMNTSLALVTQMYEKQKKLWDQKIGTEMQYLQVKAQKEASESAFAALQEQVRMTKVISPIDGTVDAINIKIGQAIQPGMPAVSVINFSTLKVKADVAESYAARVKNGNEVLVIFPDMHDSVRSKIHYASRGINAVTRTFGVEVPLDNKKEYHPNQVARLRINDYTSEKAGLVLPVKFIQRGSSEKFVMVAEKGKAVKKTVQIAREYGGLAEIASGLKEGDLVITSGYDLVNEGDKVNVKS
jgi:membrane fusion protein, multidrug efflux system